MHRKSTQDNYSITLQVNNYYTRLNIIAEKADLRYTAFLSKKELK
jgi:hypothetical protein